MNKTPETKLTVDGEFNPNREGSSEMKFTFAPPSELPPPLITFHAVTNRPILTIKPDGKIELGEDADPTEAAAQCIEAMNRLLQGMLERREQDTVKKIVAWLRDDQSYWFDPECADAVEAEEWKR